HTSFSRDWSSDVCSSDLVLWSPRVGINFDPTGDQQNQIRANVGIYTGPPPYILIGNAYANTGLGLVTLSCTDANTPQFTIDVNQDRKSRRVGKECRLQMV